MPLPIGYQRDIAGKVVPFGQPTAVYDATFLRGEAITAYPWLSTSNSGSATGTPAADVGSVAQDASNAGYLRVGTAAGATSIGDAALLLGPTLYTQQCRAIHFEAIGLYWNDAWTATLAANLSIGMRNIGGSNAGVVAQQLNTDDTTQFRAAGVAGSADAHYEMRTSGEANKRRHVGILLIPGTKEVYLTEGGIDNVWDWASFPTMADGAVRPYLAVGAQEAVRKAFRVSRIRLSVWQY